MAKDYIVHKAVEFTALSQKLQSNIKHVDRIITPKYDGCHAVFCFDGGDFVNAYSRTGEVIRSMNHIADALVYHYDLSKGRTALCGEAWYPGQEFSKISGMFRSHSPQLSMGFVPFDVVPWMYNTDATGGPVVYLGETEQGTTKVPYKDRRKAIEQGFATCDSTVQRPTSMTHVEDVAALARHYKSLGGYDGAISADPEGRYLVGSGKGGEFIKIKPLLSDSLVCVGIDFAKGEKTGKNTASLVVVYGGSVQNVSTGLTQAEVEEFFTNPSKIIGKVIEVEAMGITVNGLLREPRYKGIRNDA